MLNLAERVSITPRFLRSIRIDTDLAERDILRGYVLPASARNLLENLASQVMHSGQLAFTWTGPFGGGKSSLAILLGAFLAGTRSQRTHAMEILGEETCGRLSRALLEKTKKWHFIPVIGSGAQPSVAIGSALTSRGIVRRRKRNWADGDVIAAFRSQLDNDSSGMLLMIDEMGKFLEGAARVESDVFLFQELAELSVRSKGRFLIVGLLHQAFDEYARKLSRETQDEWAKIQGRFSDTALNPGVDEQLELLSRALNSSERSGSFEGLARNVAKQLKLPQPNGTVRVTHEFSKCWPIHPVTAWLLGPLSKRRFGQNQRSVFGFLSSGEPRGFQAFLQEASKDGLYTPDLLWDYLRINLEPSILASGDGHKWSLGVEVVDRCESTAGSKTHLQLLKTIALLDLIRDRTNIAASPELLALCCSAGSMGMVRSALAELQARSFVVFRKHLDAYSIFAGSDFDLEKALRETLEANPALDLRRLKSLAAIPPVLAKRHYHETGAFRWATVDFVSLADLPHYTPEQKLGQIGDLLIVIPTSGEAKKVAEETCSEAMTALPKSTVLGLSFASLATITLVRELDALGRIQDDRAEIAGDPVARREVQAVLSETKSRLDDSFAELLASTEWYPKRSTTDPCTSAELSGLVSDLANSLFSESPRIKNELLNRRKPSSNAIAAQKALLKRMVLHSSEPRLGIVGYPAEGGLYDSILQASGLHGSKVGGPWCFSAPSMNADPANIRPLWNAGLKLLKDRNTPVSLSDIYTLWQDPPFGLREGLMPIMATSLILAESRSLALYRNAVFQLKFTDIDVEEMTANPGSIQLRWVEMKGVSQKSLAELAELIAELSPGKPIDATQPLEVARALIGLYEGLHPYVKRTMRLSDGAIAVRDLFKRASDPHKLLFRDLPALFRKTSRGLASQEEPILIGPLKEALLELAASYVNTLNRLKGLLFSELHVSSEASALLELKERAQCLHQASGDFRLDAFVGRLRSFTGALGEVEELTALAAERPPREWTDRDIDHASLELAQLAQRFVRGELFVRVQGRKPRSHALAILVGFEGVPSALVEEFSIRESDRRAVEALAAKVSHVLSGDRDHGRNIVLAALAHASAEVLTTPVVMQVVSKSNGRRKLNS